MKLQMKPVAKALDEFFQGRKNGQKELHIAKLWSNWEQIMGSVLAAMARPVGHRDRVLVLGVEDSVVMQELVFYSQDILQRVEAFLGWRPFDKVKLELLNSRTSLDMLRLEHSWQEVSAVEMYSSLQKAELDLDPGTAVGSCYQAYKKMLWDLGLYQR